MIAGDEHVYSVKEAKVVSAEMHAHNTFDAPELVKEEVFTAYKKCADGIKSCFRHAVWWNCACNNAKWTGSYGRIRTVLQKMRTGKTIRGRSGGISLRYLAQLTPEEQAEDVTYARRLACCGKCTWYGEHMCRACGCYVQLRAAVKGQNCPYENGNKKERRMIHDPAIFYDEVSGNYYTYSTGAICQKSKDLVHWQEIGKVVERPPQESVEWTGSEDIWAPDIVKVGKEYRLYCSNSSWGVRQSCIFLAVADCPEGPFEPKGVCLKQQKNFRRVLPMQLMQILSRMQKQGSSICFMALSGVAAMY